MCWQLFEEDVWSLNSCHGTQTKDVLLTLDYLRPLSTPNTEKLQVPKTEGLSDGGGGGAPPPSTI